MGFRPPTLWPWWLRISSCEHQEGGHNSPKIKTLVCSTIISKARELQCQQSACLERTQLGSVVHSRLLHWSCFPGSFLLRCTCSCSAFFDFQCSAFFDFQSMALSCTLSLHWTTMHFQVWELWSFALHRFLWVQESGVGFLNWSPDRST